MDRKLRPCWKYVPVRCTLAEIKKGDVYRLSPFDETDLLNGDVLWLANEDATPDEAKGFGSVVMATPLVPTPDMPDKVFPPRETSAV